MKPRGGDKTFYKSKDLFFGLVLSIIAQLLKINVVDSKIKSQILDISESVLTKSEYHCHLQNVNLLSQLIEIDGSKFCSDDVSAVVKILEEMWDMLIVDRLILSQKNLHQAFIRLLLNKTLLKVSITDESISERMFKIADDIVSKSYGRKALLPVLFKVVSDYQLQDNSDFEKTTWLAKLLVRGAFLLQNIMNVFKLDIIIAGIYDKGLNLSGIPLYKQAYGDPEVSYKIYINVITASVKSSAFALQTWNYILNNDQIFHFLRPLKRTDTGEQWKRIQLLVLMVISMKRLEQTDLIRLITKTMVPKLFKEASPLCRTIDPYGL
ncbi:unnamed protein product [Ambrosiozyma monospora]|uniref:Unnamed protein product n=1 Tax=Ambrosiozyma monospora TaxID=43982 RepID=A0ACB5TTU8_AMBMO|nr:unnamed protein product [Ambrosiozyma monospora]